MSEHDQCAATLDRLFRALGHQSRRRILVFLVREGVADEGIELERLAAEVAEMNVATEDFYHVHLPRLDEVEFVDWDQEHQTIRRGPRFDEVTPLLELLDEHRDELPTGWP
ncbi:DUF7344 domain-containing protein [Haloprofundus salinisoli]|uniref:DUF7344 domain-containing protein n=1 Tax=Haloprofundus salinisoli TaxID=2876193 RepID=UPI001CC9E4F3|nr:hypothetical protein [Haloprofundus salinisoli]